MNHLPQISFKVGNLQLTIDFTDETDLEKKISEVDVSKINKMISDKFGSQSSIQPLQGFEDLVQFTESGQIKILKPPTKKTDLIKLAIFFSSDGLTTKEIKDGTGVASPKSYMPKKDFVQSGKKFALSAESRAFVLNKLIPNLRSA